MSAKVLILFAIVAILAIPVVFLFDWLAKKIEARRDEIDRADAIEEKLLHMTKEQV